MIGLFGSLCDVFTTPIQGLISLSGPSAADRELLFERGLGSLIFLGIGIGLPMLAGPADSDD